MKKLFLAVFVIALIAVQPVFAQPGQEESGETATSKGTAPPKKDKEIVININLASDEEINQALDKAKDIELVNEENTKKKEENAKKTNKEGKK